MPIPVALLAVLITSWFMTGLIWFVQVVHYPLFARVGITEFAPYHGAHAQLTTLVVGLPMLIELVSAVALVIRSETGIPSWLSWAGFAAVLAVWGSTVWVQLPLHDRLASGFDPSAYERLLTTNLVRAWLWTLHALIATGQMITWSRGAGEQPSA